MLDRSTSLLPSGNYVYSGSTVYLNSDWAGIDVHFTIDWFVFPWRDTIDKGVKGLYGGHIRVRVRGVTVLIDLEHTFPFVIQRRTIRSQSRESLISREVQKLHVSAMFLRAIRYALKLSLASLFLWFNLKHSYMSRLFHPWSTRQTWELWCWLRRDLRRWCVEMRWRSPVHPQADRKYREIGLFDTHLGW